jgi:hypothetical protein
MKLGLFDRIVLASSIGAMSLTGTGSVALAMQEQGNQSQEEKKARQEQRQQQQQERERRQQEQQQERQQQRAQQEQERQQRQQARAYQDANYGYTGMYIDEPQYNHYFRQGFPRGYDDGYYGRYRYGRSDNGTYQILANLLTQILSLRSLR